MSWLDASLITPKPYAPMHPAALAQDVLRPQCKITFGKRSGPGGQNRNRVQTMVMWEHVPTGVSASAGERRSQSENRAVAWLRLRVELALTQRGGFDLRHEPTELWQSRCGKQGRLSINPGHEDFPALLAEALEVLSLLKWEVSRAAGLLGCTPSQLLKFLKLEPRAWVLLNHERSARKMKPLL